MIEDQFLKQISGPISAITSKFALGTAQGFTHKQIDRLNAKTKPLNNT